MFDGALDWFLSHGADRTQTDLSIFKTEECEHCSRDNVAVIMVRLPSSQDWTEFTALPTEG